VAKVPGIPIPDLLRELASFGARANGFVRRDEHWVRSARRKNLASPALRKAPRPPMGSFGLRHWVRSARGLWLRLARVMPGQDANVCGMPYPDSPNRHWLRSARPELASFGAEDAGFVRRRIRANGFVWRVTHLPNGFVAHVPSPVVGPFPRSAGVV
jgi:hypothetical protein